jgi:hypothetical protein
VIQRSSTAELDASVRRLHTDMHHLADTVSDIAQRLEDKLDWLAERANGEGWQIRPMPPKRASAGIAVHSARPSDESRHSSSGSVGSDAEVDDLKNANLKDPVADRSPRRDLIDSRQPTGTDSNRQASSRNLYEIEKYEESGRVLQRRPEGRLDLSASEMSCGPPLATQGLLELGTQCLAMDKKLDRISNFLGVKMGVADGNDDEDRRRLKEKLKAAIEIDRRSRIRTIVSRSEVWMEYIFGICSPDQRMGKRGSR